MNKNVSLCINNIILWMLVIGYYFIIVSFSATSAEKSKAESSAVIDIVEKISDAVVNKTEDAGVSWLRGKTFHKIVRKTAHIINFFILGFLHSMLFFSNSRKISYTVVLTLLMGFCGAAIDEITQLFVPGRSAQVSDVFVDFFGSMMGCVLFVFLCCRYVLKLKRG